MQERPQSNQYIGHDLSGHTIKGYNFNTDDYGRLLKTFASASQYQDLQTLIMLHSDHLEGVKSYIELDPSHKVFPTGIALVREATGALQRLCPPTHPQIDVDNMLLRTLTTMRAIDHVLQVKMAKDPSLRSRFTSIQVSLNTALNFLIDHALSLRKEFTIKKEFRPGDKSRREALDKIEAQEIMFNIALRNALDEAGLSTGVKSDKDYENLLAHYRNLASTLDNAPSIMTIQRYGDFTHREIAHPITKKTPAQLKQLQVMQDGDIAGLNFHSKQSPAMREANACFYQLIIDDNRRLPAQTRKTIGPTVKNGYVVCSQLEIEGPPDLQPREPIAIAQFWTARCGAPVYIGKGESDEARFTYTEENVRQLQDHITRLRYDGRRPQERSELHMVLLLTNTPLEGQSDMLSFTKEVKTKVNQAEQKSIYWSNVPTNFEGMARILEIDPIAQESAAAADLELPSIGRDIAAKAERIRKGATVVRIANINPDVTNVIMCASGQDRTGTIQEAATEYWLQEILKKYGVDMSLEDIQKNRTLGFFNAAIASLAAPGSLGMKKDSRPDKFFTADVCDYLYRDTADTNKSAPLVEPQKALTLAYNNFIDVLHDQDSTPRDANEAFLFWAEKALAYQNSKSESKLPGFMLTWGRRIHKGSDPMPREEVNDILRELLQTSVETDDWSKVETLIRNAQEKYQPGSRGTVFDQLEGLIKQLRLFTRQAEVMVHSNPLYDRRPSS